MEVNNISLTLVAGYLYVISDQYFIDVNDPYLMSNHENGYRPYYFAVYDSVTCLYWMIPLSSKIEKFISYYKRLYYKWSNSNRPYAKDMLDKLMLGIKRVTVGKVDSIMLFQNMVPISKDYILRYYYVDKVPFKFNPETTKEIIDQAQKVIPLLRSRFKFMKTQPDVLKIEDFLLNRNQNNQ